MNMYGPANMNPFNYTKPKQQMSAADYFSMTGSGSGQNSMAAMYSALGLNTGPIGAANTAATLRNSTQQSGTNPFAGRSMADAMGGMTPGVPQGAANTNFVMGGNAGQVMNRPTSSASATGSMGGNEAYREQFSQSPVQTTVADPNQQYRDAFSSGAVQTTMPVPTNDPNADYRAAFTKAPVQTTVADPNQQYRDNFSSGAVQTVATAPSYADMGFTPGEILGTANTAFVMQGQADTPLNAPADLSGFSGSTGIGGGGGAMGGRESYADAMARLGLTPGTAIGEENITASNLNNVQGETMSDAMARLGITPGTAVGDYNQSRADLTRIDPVDMTGATAIDTGTGVATPYSALGFDDALKVGTGTGIGTTRNDYGAMAADQALLNQVRAGKLVNTDSALTDAAQQNVLDRLQGDPLGSGADLNAAMVAARNRLNNTGVSLDTNLTQQAEQAILDRLSGGSNPLIEQQRADFLQRSEDQQRQLRENLNRLGVLRSGDTAEAFGDFIGSRERTLNDINALGYDLQTQAINDALNFEGRRDNLRLANEDLARAAIGDVAGLSAQMDNRQALGAGLAGDAISQALGLQTRVDQLGLADQEMQRQARADVFGRQGQLAQLETERLGRQLAMDDASRQERGLQSDLVTAELQRRLALSGDQRAGQALGSDLSTAAQQRQLAASADLRSQQALGSDLATAAQQRALANTADQRAGQVLQSDLTTADLQRRLAQAADLRSTQALGSDLVGAAESRRLARSADERAADALRSDLVTQDLQRRLAEAGVTGQFFEAANQAPVDTLAGRAMGLEEDLARANDQRAQQQLESILFGQVQTGQTGDPIQTLAGEQARDDLLTQRLNRQLATADNLRRQQLTQQDVQNAIANRGLQTAADLRAAQALSSDLATADLQRRLSEADATGEFFARGYNQAPTQTLQSRAIEQDLAASQGAESRAERAIQDALFGRVEGEPTLSGRADQRAGTGFDREIRDLDVQQTLALAQSGFLNTEQRNQILNDLLGGIISGTTTTNTTGAGDANNGTLDGTPPPLPPGARQDPFSPDRALGAGGEVYILRQMGNEMSWEML